MLGVAKLLWLDLSSSDVSRYSTRCLPAKVVDLNRGRSTYTRQQHGPGLAILADSFTVSVCP